MKVLFLQSAAIGAVFYCWLSMLSASHSIAVSIGNLEASTVTGGVPCYVDGTTTNCTINMQFVASCGTDPANDCDGNHKCSSANVQQNLSTFVDAGSRTTPYQNVVCPDAGSGVVGTDYCGQTQFYCVQYQTCNVACVFSNYYGGWICNLDSVVKKNGQKTQYRRDGEPCTGAG